MAPASCGSPQDTAGWLLRCCLNRPRALQPLRLWHPQSGFLQPEPAVLMAGAVDPPCQSSEHSHSPRGNGGGGQVKAVLSPAAPTVWQVPHDAQQLFAPSKGPCSTAQPLAQAQLCQNHCWDPSWALAPTPLHHCSPFVSRFPAVGGSVQDFTLTAPLLQSLCVSLLSKGTSDVCALGGMVN